MSCEEGYSITMHLEGLMDFLQEPVPPDTIIVDYIGQWFAPQGANRAQWEVDKANLQRDIEKYGIEVVWKVCELPFSSPWTEIKENLWARRNKDGRICFDETLDWLTAAIDSEILCDLEKSVFQLPHECEFGSLVEPIVHSLNFKRFYDGSMKDQWKPDRWIYTAIQRK